MKCITATFIYVATVAHDQCIATDSKFYCKFDNNVTSSPLSLTFSNSLR